jgi:hypothetical protein
MIRIIRLLQFIGILAIQATAYFLGTAWLNDVKDVDQLEMSYLVFCGTVAYIFFTVFITFLLETCVINKCIKEVKKMLKERISDLFPSFNYTMELSTYQVIMVRPLIFDEGKPLILSGNDYYEYVKDHRPDSENYYKSTNPFELDPHEKNFAKMMLIEKKQRDLAEKRKARKDKMLKGFGGKKKGGKFQKANKFGGKKVNKLG